MASMVDSGDEEDAGSVLDLLEDRAAALEKFVKGVKLDTHKNSPIHKAKKSEPVFKTPMSFSPRLVGDKARPSPSRVELWKEELGLEDDGDSAGSEEISNSDDETEVDQNTNKLVMTAAATPTDEKPSTSPIVSLGPPSTCSLVEYEALQKELEERSAQRDELLYRIKTLNDKNKMYKSRLEREELTKKQQLKILRRTHEVHLEEKSHLITNLEAIVNEQEMRVFALEANLKGEKVDDSDREHSPVSRLLSQIETLQSEKVGLVHQVEQSSAEVERLRATTAGETESLQERLDGLERENSKLQEDVVLLRNLKSTGSTDAEKQVCRLEIENDRLQREVRDTSQALARLQSQTDGQSQVDNKIIKKLKEDNVVLGNRISELESELADKNQKSDSSEKQLKGKLKELDAEYQHSARQVRDLSAKLTALQAKSPEVVTKVQRVEVENSQTQELLDLTRKENEQLQEQIESLREQLANETSLQTKLRSENENLTKAKTNLEQELVNTKQLATSSSNEASARFRVEIEELRDQLNRSTNALESKCVAQGAELDKLRSEKTRVDERLQEKEVAVKEMESHLESAEKKTEEIMNQFNRQEEEATIVQDQLHAELARFQVEVTTLKESKAAAVEKIRRESAERQRELECRLLGMEEHLNTIKPAMAILVSDYRKLRETCRSLPMFIKREIDATTKKLVKALTDISKYNEELVRKYRKEMALRKKYHNELVELKGNIRVFARLRPRIKEDGSGPHAEIVADVDHEDDGLVNVSYKGRVQTFEVDKAFMPNVSQSDVFSEVQALVTSCIDGYNICIFAYGQTGSGKTFTMEGTMQDPGINQRALKQLFLETAERSAEWRYTMSVSVLEIYNEMIRDLLSDDPNQKLEIKMAPEGGVHVPGMVSYEVHSVEDVNQVFAVGRKNRQTASTNMNEHSSRSHALLCVNVVGTNITTGATATGKLNLVDLAGSERVSKSGADGDRLKEAQNINKSLSCLGDVIHALRSRQPHVPYRNSKLTYLLQDSLGGDSKTLMIVQVSPVDKNVNETNASLSFAQRVRSVELGMATRRVENGDGTPNGEATNGIPNGRSLIKTPQHGSNSKLPMARRK